MAAKKSKSKKSKSKKTKTKKDSCYYAAKRAHKVFPSAYASGMIAKCRKKKAGKSKTKAKKKK
jgi:hypothetical protein